MRFSHASRTRLVAIGLGLTTAGLGLAGCGTVDDALFGAGSTPPAPATPTEASPQAAASTTPSSDTGAPAAGEAAPAPATAELGLTLGTIEPGSDTGTSVGQTVQRLRTELSTLHDKVATDLQQYAALKGSAAQSVTTYYEEKSHITIRLQVGTTKGNPELVGEWNTAQSALDTLTGNINSFAALATEITADTGRAHTEHATISDSFNMAGGVDEDHRQLTVLQQEAAQMEALLDRLQADVTRNVQRQAAFVAYERSSLASLATDIKNGELYATTGTTTTTAPLNSAAGSTESSKAIKTIRFNRPKVDFEQDLYTALNQALQAKPGASFSVVAVSPPGGSAAALAKAQREAQQHARDVLKSMTDMGVPASRVTISSSTDPAVSSIEVRVYAR
jgi:hypothetical protein